MAVGSICSGMMTEHWACLRMPWQFKKAFWCEKDPHARKFILDNVGPDVPNFVDVTSVEFQTHAPYCDLLVAGFPCQSFSIMGLGNGLEDPRGIVVLHILRYVQSRRPRIVVLENVKGLITNHRETLVSLVASLERMHYFVSWRLLDTK